MSEITKVYLDNNATTAPDPELIQALGRALEVWGNPSSIHWAGQRAKTLVRESRQNIAQALGVSPLELIFTSGGTEANNTVLKGCWSKLQKTRPEFITTAIEHPSVLKTLRWCEEQGAIVHVIPVKSDTGIDLNFYERVLTEKTALVSAMFANNETGMILPIQQMAEMAHRVGALFHSDCVQAFGKMPLNLKDLDVDFASLSAHKFYALKGSGILYAKKGVAFEPLLHGGAQERQRRGGTENTLGQFAMGFMAQKIRRDVEYYFQKMAHLHKILETRILTEIPNCTLTSGLLTRLPNTSSFVIQGVDGETLLMSLDLKGFAVSTGAACSSGNPEPSPVLLALGLSREQAQSSLRVSLSWHNEESDVHSFIETLKEIVLRLRSLKQMAEEREQHAGI